MKLYLTIFFAVVLSLPMLAQQDDDPNEKPPFVRAAIIAGMNISQVDGDGIAGFRKFGANGGAAAYVNIHKGFNDPIEGVYIVIEYNQVVRRCLFDINCNILLFEWLCVADLMS